MGTAEKADVRPADDGGTGAGGTRPSDPTAHGADAARLDLLPGRPGAHRLRRRTAPHHVRSVDNVFVSLS